MAKELKAVAQDQPAAERAADQGQYGRGKSKTPPGLLKKTTTRPESGQPD